MENIRPIRNNDDLAWAIKEIEPYFDNEPESGSESDDRFAVLSVLISDYEAKHFAVEPLDPVTMIATYIRDHGLSGADFGRVIGSRSHASEILSRRRALNLTMINKIANAWHLPLGDLARPYPLAHRNEAA